MVFAALRAAVPRLASELAFAAAHLPPIDLSVGESGYQLATLQVCAA
eukprot:gene19603-25567_t